MFAFIKILPDRNERQAGVRLFARSISIWRTSEDRFIYSLEPDWELCNDALFDANQNFQFQFARECCQVVAFILPIKRDKTSPVSNKHDIIAQYSYDISTLREISDGPSSNRQT